MPKKAQLSKEERAVQGTAMMVSRLAESRTHAEIAMLFGASTATVKKRLAEARAGTLAMLAQEVIADRMMHKALAVLEDELDKGNYEAAKDVLFGSQVLQKGGKAVIEHVTSNSPTLDSIRKERAKAIEAEVVVRDEPVDPGTDASS